MKRIFTLMVMLLFAIFSFGQGKTKTSPKKKDDFLLKIDRINKSLAFYGDLSPFSDNDNRFELIDSTRDEITGQLLDVLNDKRIVKYQMEKLLDQIQMTIKYTFFLWTKKPVVHSEVTK
jgi:hypothetical protein